MALLHVTVTPVSLAFPVQQRQCVGLTNASPDKNAVVEAVVLGPEMVIQPAPTLLGSG